MLKITLTVLIALFILLITLAWLRQSGLEQQFKDYHQRLSRVLNLNEKALSLPKAKLSITWRDYRRSEPELRLSFISTFSLRACGLDNLLYQANSQLGKTTRGFERYWLHHQITQTLELCLGQIPSDSSLGKELRTLFDLKHSAHENYWSNFVSEDETLRRLWQSGKTLSDDPSAQFRTLAQHLQVLHRFRMLNDELNKDDALRQLEALRLLPGINSLWRALYVSRLSLEVIVSQVAQRNLACPKNKAVLENILHGVYMPRLGKRIAQFDHAAQGLLQAATPFFEGTSLSSRLIDFEKELSAFQNANRAHVQMWRDLLNSCAIELKPSTKQ